MLLGSEINMRRVNGEKEMVCYGEVFSSLWAPDAYIGKYVFRRVSDETVAEWDGKYVAEKAGD